MQTRALARKIAQIVAGPALIVLIWHGIAVFGRFEDSLLPSPADVARAAWEVVGSGFLVDSLVASLARFCLGYIAASVAGIVLGLILGRLPALWRFVNPVVQLLRPVSPIAWFPFIVLFLGIGSIPAIAIIFIAAFFPVLLSTVNSAARVDTTILRVAANFGIRQPALTVKIILPASFPGIAMGLHVALGAAWVFLVAGEMIGAQSGLGFLIIDARNNLRADMVLVGIISIAVLGLLLDRLITIFESWVGTHWGTHRRESR